VRTPGRDLLIFACAVKPRTWMQLDVRRRDTPPETTVANQSGQLLVSYPDLCATIDAHTGMLVQLEVFGQRLLDGPLAISLSKIKDDNGTKEPLGAPRVRLASQASNGAMTELHFILEATDRLALAVSYRIHACGLVEICSDQRPWQGRSPCGGPRSRRGVSHRRQKRGATPVGESRAVLRFKDFAEVVKHAASIHRYPQATVLELAKRLRTAAGGTRRPLCTASSRNRRSPDLAELADEGFVVEALPKTTPLPTREIRIAYPTGNQAAAQLLADALKQKGPGGCLCRDLRRGKRLRHSPDAPCAARQRGIEGDGFEIRPEEAPKACD